MLRRIVGTAQWILALLCLVLGIYLDWLMVTSLNGPVPLIVVAVIFASLAYLLLALATLEAIDRWIYRLLWWRILLTSASEHRKEQSKEQSAPTHGATGDTLDYDRFMTPQPTPSRASPSQSIRQRAQEREERSRRYRR